MLSVSRIIRSGALVPLLATLASAQPKSASSNDFCIGANFGSTIHPAFTKNIGQWPDSILFRTSANGAALWFTKSGIYHQLYRRIARPAAANDPLLENSRPPGKFAGDSDSVETVMIKAEFVDANPAAAMCGIGELAGRNNYFIGDDPAQWRSDVPNYAAITLRDVYPGVDITYRVTDGQLTETHSFARGVDPSQVQLRYRTSSERVTAKSSASSETIVSSAFGDIAFRGSLRGSAEESAPSAQKSLGSSSPTELTIVYSTYLGGSELENSNDIVVDGSGSAYVTGHAFSTNFPTVNPYQVHQSLLDAFVTKLSPSGNALTYSTYLGGALYDWSYSIAVDGAGAAYITGVTESANFPVLPGRGPYQGDQPLQDAFVTKLNPAGNSLAYSTYLGGDGWDEGRGIDVDNTGYAYVSGFTYSSNFPVLSQYQTNQTDADAFVTRFNPTGTALSYSSYLGGSGGDFGYAVDAGPGGDLYVTGYTLSGNFPTVNAYQGDNVVGDAFVTKLRLVLVGQSLQLTPIYSTYLGGDSHEEATDIVVDNNGFAYITGYTLSTNYPTYLPFQTNQVELLYKEDGFITKLNATGNGLVYSSYLGGDARDWAYGIAIDNSGNAYVGGVTESTNFPVVNEYQTDQGSFDAFISAFNSSGSGLIYSTYLGGISTDFANGLAIDSYGAAYLVGYTYTQNFPLVHPYQGLYQGAIDGFVTKLKLTCCDLGGDADNGGDISIGDMSWIVAYMFQGGAAPPCPNEGDADGSGSIDIGDVSWIVAYMFQGGAAPLCGP